jgi:LysR family glycine cleavage system transcriptional activator
MTTIPLNALRTFEAVASQMSFAKGAAALHVSPAAVSSQIRLLEQRLKQPLFHRQGRQIALTEAGKKLLPGVQRGLAELRQAVQAVGTDRSEGVLNISAMQSLLQKWMLPRLADFYKAHPEIDLRVNADNGLVNFQQSDFHAGIRFGPGKWPGLKAEKLMDDWILPVCSPEMLREIGPVKTIQDLQGHDLFFVESGILDAWFRVVGDSGKESHWPLLNDTLSILMAAEQGQGIALSRWSLAARDIEAGRLVRPIDTVVKTDWSYYFVSPPHFFNLPKVKIFRQWLQDHCARFPTPE